MSTDFVFRNERKRRMNIIDGGIRIDTLSFLGKEFQELRSLSEANVTSIALCSTVWLMRANRISSWLLGKESSLLDGNAQKERKVSP